jgi:hypothetical protein
MTPRLTTVLTGLKTEWEAQPQPDAMMSVCQEAGYASWRDRVLTPVTAIQLADIPLHTSQATLRLIKIDGTAYGPVRGCRYINATSVAGPSCRT